MSVNTSEASPLKKKTSSASTPHWRRYFGQLDLKVDFFAISMCHLSSRTSYLSALISNFANIQLKSFKTHISEAK